MFVTVPKGNKFLFVFAEVHFFVEESGFITLMWI